MLIVLKEKRFPVNSRKRKWLSLPYSENTIPMLDLSKLSNNGFMISALSPNGLCWSESKPQLPLRSIFSSMFCCSRMTNLLSFGGKRKFQNHQKMKVVAMFWTIAKAMLLKAKLQLPRKSSMNSSIKLSMLLL